VGPTGMVRLLGMGPKGIMVAGFMVDLFAVFSFPLCVRQKTRKNQQRAGNSGFCGNRNNAALGKSVEDFYRPAQLCRLEI
jgi:hypothetical protein